jgi:hypothetical protein
MVSGASSRIEDIIPIEDRNIVKRSAPLFATRYLSTTAANVNLGFSRGLLIKLASEIDQNSASIPNAC